MHYLLTGHTGFKGAWLVLLLRALGHRVTGVALPPEPESLFELAGLESTMAGNHILDIRDFESLKTLIREVNPDVAIHFAAQPIVKLSYQNPRETFETNVNGTMNFLSSTQDLPNLAGRLVITSDKVYRNDGRASAYVEGDALGGKDPYSASKAMADVLTSSWISSFPGPPTSIARAGNVIGGGDSSPYRLLPDFFRASENNERLVLRYPAAVRPWQHVLDCLAGYLKIMDDWLETGVGDEWNVGPEDKNLVEVQEVVSLAAELWGDPVDVSVEEGVRDHEEHLLTLSSDKLIRRTGWRNVLDVSAAIGWTVAWHKAIRAGKSPLEVSIQQVEEFLELSRNNGDV